MTNRIVSVVEGARIWYGNLHCGHSAESRTAIATKDTAEADTLCHVIVFNVCVLIALERHAESSVGTDPGDSGYVLSGAFPNSRRGGCRLSRHRNSHLDGHRERQLVETSRCARVISRRD